MNTTSNWFIQMGNLFRLILIWVVGKWIRLSLIVCKWILD
jgi:hypothetical protein